jgi:hypothetical protein
VIISLIRNGMPLVPLHEFEGKQVVIQQWSGTRSNQANRYFHGVVIPAWMDYTGYDKEAMKHWLKYMYAPTVSICIDGKWIDSPKSTAEMTVKEMMVFIDTCIREAAEHGIHIAPPPYNDSFSPIPNE